MATTLGIVEVPTPQLRPEGDAAGDDGAAGQLASRRFGNKSVLEWVVRRVTESLLLDRVVIVTDGGQGSLVERLAPPDVPVFIGSHPDVLARLAGAVEHFSADQIVRVPLCCPFIDPEVIDRLVCTAAAQPMCDYIGYFSVDGRPAVLSKVGLFAEWCRADAIRRANQLARRAAERADSLQFVISHPDRFQLRFIPLPDNVARGEVRLMLEADEDWDVADLIVEALGPDQLDWRRIVGFLEQQPTLRRRLERQVAAHHA